MNILFDVAVVNGKKKNASVVLGNYRTKKYFHRFSKTTEKKENLFFLLFFKNSWKYKYIFSTVFFPKTAEKKILMFLERRWKSF